MFSFLAYVRSGVCFGADGWVAGFVLLAGCSLGVCLVCLYVFPMGVGDKNFVVIEPIPFVYLLNYFLCGVYIF